MKKKLLMSIALILLLFSAAVAQNKTISGIVRDALTAQPLADVSIVATGSAIGAITNNEGRFSLEVPQDTKSINVSLVNYQSTVITITDSLTLTIILTPEVKGLDEVIVVGYGSQKKKDLTGSIATISAKEVAGRKTVQVSEALQGSIAGVSVTRSSAAPGAGSSILIRGITTIGTNSPLIIVDGVPVSSIDLVNPNDVESLSVLKDAASAAIYGSRGAAGVILITTKRGKNGKGTLEYNYEYGIQTPTALPKYVGVQDYFRYFNEQSINDGGSALRTDEFINSYLDSNRANPDGFPNVDWQKAVLTNRYAPRTRHDLSFTGGSERLKTKASLGYQKVGAFYDNYTYQRYQFRVNNDLKISDKLSANLDVFYRNSSVDQPLYNPISDSRIYPAWYDDFYDDGRYAPGKDGSNPLAQVREGGSSKQSLNQFSGRLGLQYKPVTGLTLMAMVTPIFDWDKDKRFNAPIRYFAKEDPARVVAVNATPRAILEERRNENFTVNGQFLVNYTKEINDAHNIDILAGYEQNYGKFESLRALRTGFPLLGYPYLSAGTTEIMESYGSAEEFSLQSFFGRLQYNFRSKYYVQGNLRNDRSSRFATQYRSALFPSVSAGWAISEESFLKNKRWLSFLKLRGSWGNAGNERLLKEDQVTPNYYPYQAVLNFSNALFYQNGVVTPQPGLGQQIYAVENISWETSRNFDIGFDAAFLDNRLSVTADYYKKTTFDILLPLDIPLYIGYDKPNQNAGTLYVWGWELTAGWKDRVGKVNYAVSANLSDAKSKIGDLKGTQFLGDQVTREGSEYNEWFGYLSDGLFQTQEEVAGAPVLNANTKPGDIRYKDVNKDGKITPDDRVLLGGALPRYLYGGNLYADYGSFDLSIAFQGIGKRLSRLNTDVIRPFQASFGNVPENMAGNFWSNNNTPEQNLRAVYPRLSVVMAPSNYALSDFWLMNGAYFRLKNITLGYTLKEKLLNRVGMQSLRLYISANDLFSISKFPNYLDPESANSSYPIIRTFLAGAIVKF